jgi:hypothetical protein
MGHDNIFFRLKFYYDLPLMKKKAPVKKAPKRLPKKKEVDFEDDEDADEIEPEANQLEGIEEVGEEEDAFGPSSSDKDDF